MRSLRARLLFAASITLAFFLLLVGVSLNNAFQASARQTQYERMQGLVYALLAKVEPNSYGELSLANFDLPDARLERPQSGLEAALFSENASLLWGSASLSDRIEAPPPLPPGEWQFVETPNTFTLRFGLRYANPGSPAKRYTLMVVEDSSTFRGHLRLYRRTLALALGACAVVLLLVQGAVLRWSLRPLQRLVSELRQVERGERESIAGRYPTELTPLTQGLNAMIVAERNRQSRYRNALGDLAHSLKTPLAVLRGIAERPSADTPTLLNDQVSRMDNIVQHQLKRAATLGQRSFTEPIAIRPIVDKLVSALGKVYAHKGASFVVHLPDSLRLRADAGDLFELLGNLLENAAKYGQQQVQITGERQGGMLVITIADDGPGFPAQGQDLLLRGVRADTRQEGQGLGLAAVADIVEAYGGSLNLGQSPLGGGLVTLKLAA